METTTDLDHSDVLVPTGDEDDPCPACGVQMEHDRFEEMDFCPNDWAHG